MNRTNSQGWSVKNSRERVLRPHIRQTSEQPRRLGFRILSHLQLQAENLSQHELEILVQWISWAQIRCCEALCWF
jgi:hypothetical protein